MRRLALSLGLLLLVFPFAIGLDADTWIRVQRRVPGTRAAGHFKPGEVIVRFATATSQSRAGHAMAEAGGLRARRSAYGDRYLVSLAPGTTVEAAIAHFRAMPEVELAEPNFLVHADFSPDDPLFRYQWHLKADQVNAPRTWDIQEGKAEVAVAVVDSGIAYEDFGPYRKAPDWGDTEFLQGYDFVNGDTHANDDDGHGTHVASTIAEGTDNGQGVAGLAFRCTLLPLKVLDNEGNGAFFDVADGIDFATNYSDAQGRKVKVINLSLGGPDPSETAKAAIDRAVAAGIVVVAAAGNDGTQGVQYPAAYPNVIAVGATDLRKQRAFYSDYGPEISVVAPGGDIDRDDDGDGYPDGILQQTFDGDSARQGLYDDFGYYFFDGTSSATPQVAATAALLVAQGITSPEAVRKAIESTALDLGPPGRDDETGYGLIQPAAALKGLGLNQ
jgi:serine protease